MWNIWRTVFKEQTTCFAIVTSETNKRRDEDGCFGGHFILIFIVQKKKRRKADNIYFKCFVMRKVACLFMTPFVFDI